LKINPISAALFASTLVALPPIGVKKADLYPTYRILYKFFTGILRHLWYDKADRRKYISDLGVIKKSIMKTLLLIAGIGLTLGLMSSRPHDHAFFPGGGAILKSFDKPDEVREFPKGKLELVSVNGAVIGRATLQPGWKWSESVQPLVNTKSCEAPHFQYHVAGTLMVKMDDGTLLECTPGSISMLPLGHDAWVKGNEPVVVVDFQGMVDYATSK
jgi:hypothetical protein